MKIMKALSKIQLAIGFCVFSLGRKSRSVKTSLFSVLLLHPVLLKAARIFPGVMAFNIAAFTADAMC